MKYYVYFLIINLIASFIRSFSFAYGGIRCAEYIHNDLLKKLIVKPLLFFDQNPLGRIVNRINQDIWSVDDELPFQFNILIKQLYVVIGTISIIIISNTRLSLPLLLVIIGYLGIQRKYRTVCRDLRRLDTVTRSPLYSHFIESLSGSIIIRIFHKIPFYLDKSLNLIDRNQCTVYSVLSSAQWFSLYVQYIGFIIIAVILVLYGQNISCIYFNVLLLIASDSMSAGLIGLCLSYSLPLINTFSVYILIYYY